MSSKPATDNWPNFLVETPPAGSTEQALFAAALAHEQWRKREVEIESSMSLEPDWDGEGARPPELDVVQTALRLARAIRESDGPPPSSVSISHDGSIILAWNLFNGYREVEIEEAESAQWMSRKKGCRAEHWTENVSLRSRDGATAWNTYSIVNCGTRESTCASGAYSPIF